MNKSFKLDMFDEKIASVAADLVDREIPVFAALYDPQISTVKTYAYHKWGNNDGFDIVLASWYASMAWQGEFDANTATRLVTETQNMIFDDLRSHGYDPNPKHVDFSKIPVNNPQISKIQLEQHREQFKEILVEANHSDLYGMVAFGTSQVPMMVVYAKDGEQAAAIYLSGLQDVLQNCANSPECLWLYNGRLYLAWKDYQENFGKQA